MIAESRWAEGQRKIQLALWEAAERLLASVPLEQIEVMAPTEEGHGDFTSNLAFRLAKPLSKAPVKIAAELASGLPSLGLLERVEVAGAGFINFWLNSTWLSDTVSEAVRHPDSFGESASRQERVLIEFVSANPTGPLVVVNGRAAAWGDSLARVMSAAGYDVDREFYVNDAGMQVVKLGNALAIRLEELKGAPLPETWPEGVYPGEYVRALAQDYAESHGTWKSLGLQEQYWPELGRWAAERLRAQQEAELLRFGVTFDRWYSEKRLRQEGKPEAVVAELDERNQLYQAEGARWFRSTAFGDQKDYVVVKSDGGFTYIVPDAAYHADKFARGYDLLIDLLGPDHHGHLSRMRAIMAGLGYSPEKLEMLIIQMVRLLRGGQPVKMSKRGGAFVTLAELMDEVEVDAARWFFVERSSDTPMDFDLDLAQMKTQDNPVYYVQYAGARIHSILAAYASQFADDQQAFDPSLLVAPLEQALIRDVAKLPVVVARAAQQRAPQAMCRYLTEMASHFHAFYRQHRILEEAPDLRRARIELIRGVLVAIQRATAMIGVSVPQRM